MIVGPKSSGAFSKMTKDGKQETDLTWDEARKALAPLLRIDGRKSFGAIVREYAYLSVVLTGCVLAHGAWLDGKIGTLACLPILGFGVFLVSVGQHRLSGLAHDASHYALFRNRLANELVADLFLMFPILALTQKYRAAHLGHHQFVNDPERDSDLIRLNHPEPHHFPISKWAFWRRYVIQALWPPTILRYLYGRARSAKLGNGSAETPGPRPIYRASVAKRLRGAYWLSVLTVVHASGGWPIFWLFWVLPLLTFYPLLMQLREIAHHSNAPDDGDLTNSRVFRVHPILRACVFPYGQDFHLTHHLFMTIPHYRLPEAHDILNRYRPYREQVSVCQGYFFRSWGTKGPTVLDLLALPRVEAISSFGGPKVLEARDQGLPASASASPDLKESDPTNIKGSTPTAGT